MSNTALISNGKAIELHLTMAKLNTKSQSNTDYVKTLQLKRAVKKIEIESEGLRDDLYADQKLEKNFDGSIAIPRSDLTRMNEVNKALINISKAEVPIGAEIQYMDFKDFESVRKSNELTLEEEDLLIEWLVDPATISVSSGS